MREISIRCMFSRVALFFCCLAFIAFLASHARADGPQPILSGLKIAQTSQASWTIHADKLMYDQEKQLYEASGNVKITSTDRMIQADYASVNKQTQQADLNGNVTVQYGRNWIKGEHVIWRLDTEKGWVDSGILYFAENNFFIQGKAITKLSPTEFDIKEGFVTSCNPADPDWKIQFNAMKVTVGGNGWAYGSSFWGRSWPVAYVPLLGMPVETERQSGFLVPIEGNSTLNGWDMEVPYYWAFRGDMDATFYARYMSNRGFMGGVEYRINNPEFGKGIWSFNFLQDHANQALLATQGYPFQTEDRYWVRGRQDITLPWNITAKIDVDYVSDRNFIQEFSSGSTSFARNNAQFGMVSGRGILDDMPSLVRESTAYFEKKGESELLSMDIRYWQDFQPPPNTESIQKLPSLDFTIIPKWIDNTPFYYTFQGSAVNYWRTQGDTDQRLDFYPRLYYPMHWGNYLDFEPSVGLRANAYAIEWGAGNSGSNFAERDIPDFRLEMSTRLNREFNVDFWNLTAVQNSIRPEISYEYATQSTNGTIPQFDRLDLDQSRNGVRYGFSSFWTGKQVSPNAAGELTTTYTEIARFRVFQFFNVVPPPFEDPLFDTFNVMREGFSPVGFRMDIVPRQYLTVSYDVDVDLSSSGQGNAQGLFLSYDNRTGNVVQLSYQDIPSLQVDEIVVQTILKTYKNIYLETYHDYSLEGGLMFTQGYGIRYIHGCWGVGGGYERVGADNRFVFTIDLLGLGSLGQVSTFFGRPLFGEPMPGYQHPETWNYSR
ncbi:MAG TPA: LPS-assembly protein LptD [Deltaproteobacteria bacterium]|nr:LPS-assembly protein LptD [Deltaproteobacteria bacterium]